MTSTPLRSPKIWRKVLSPAGATEVGRVLLGMPHSGDVIWGPLTGKVTPVGLSTSLSYSLAFALRAAPGSW